MLLLATVLLTASATADFSEQVQAARTCLQALEGLDSLARVAQLGGLIPELTVDDLDDLDGEDELDSDATEALREYVDGVLSIYGSALLSERIESAQEVINSLVEESNQLDDLELVEMSLEEMVSRERRLEIQEQVLEALQEWREVVSFFEIRAAALGEVASQARAAQRLASATVETLETLVEDFGWAIAVATLGTAAAAEILARAEQCRELSAAMEELASESADLRERYVSNLETLQVNIRMMQDLSEVPERS